MSPALESPAPQVTLVSSFTVDRFPPDEHGRRKEIPGGPAHYVGSALQRLQIPYVLITGEMASVDVIPGPEGEHYLIPPLPTIPLPERIGTPAVILSPIVAEIDPENVPRMDGLLVVDLQGFVRRPLRSTDDMVETDLTTLLRRADIVKAAEEEIRHLSPPSIEALADTLLIKTHGARGATLDDRGTVHTIAGHPVAASHTVGAGDTFLAAFVSSFLQGGNPEEAGRQAARFTEAFLQERTGPRKESGPDL